MFLHCKSCLEPRDVWDKVCGKCGVVLPPVEPCLFCKGKGYIDDDAKIKKNITNHTDPIHGKTEIRLDPADTELLGEYFYDIQVKTPAGAIITIATSSIMFNYDVTRRVN